jgi:hypothetical protein
VLALPLEWFTGQRAQHDLERLIGALTRLLEGQTEAAELERLVAPRHANLETTAGQVVGERDVLRHAQWVPERQHENRGADAHTLGDRCRPRRQQ